MFYGLWKGAREDAAVHGPKPYRKAYMEKMKQFLEKVEVEWNAPIMEGGLFTGTSM
jgi:hypothetical protein